MICMPTSDNALARRRIVGIDVARFTAIIGMMAAHLVSVTASGVEGTVGKVIGATVSSTAATTFAVLGGVSLVLLARSMNGRSTARMLGSILLRGLLVSLLGLLLEQLDGPISVILTAYGVSMMIAAFALLLPSWTVGAVTGILWLAGGAINANVRAALTTAPDDDSPTRLVGDLLLTGHYPAITWVAYMLVGILIARMLTTLDPNRLRRLCLQLSIGGIAVYLVITILGRVARMRPAWFSLPDLGDQLLSSGRGAPIGTAPWMALIPTPHSGTPTDMLRTVAGACFLIGLFVLIFDVRGARLGFVGGAIRAAGAAPLTIYTAHVVATAALHHAEIAAFPTTPWFAHGLLNFGVQFTAVLAVGAALATLGTRGPLEALLAAATGSRRHAKQPHQGVDYGATGAHTR